VPIVSSVNLIVHEADDGQTDRIFEEEIDRLTGKTNTMGIIEQVKQMKLDEAMRVARREGKREEKIELVKRLLTMGYSVKEITIIAAVSEAFVNKMKLELKVK